MANDYALFVAIIACLFVYQELIRRMFYQRAIHSRVESPEMKAFRIWFSAIAAGIVVALLGGGGFYVDHLEKKAVLATKEATTQVGNLLAEDLRRLDYNEVNASSAKRDSLNEMLRRWVRHDPRLARISTVGVQDDGSVKTVLESSPLVPPGVDPATQARGLVQEAWSGAVVFRIWGETPHVYVPVLGRNGAVDAVLIAEFFPGLLGDALSSERYLAMGILFVLLLFLNSIYWSIYRSRMDSFLATSLAAELAESEQRFRNFANHAPVLLQVIDPQGEIRFLNQTWLDFVGDESEAVQGRGWLDYIHPEDRVKFEELFRQAFMDHAPFQTEFRLRHVDRGYCWMMASYIPRWQHDMFAGMMGSVADISEHRQLEMALQYQVEFEKKVATISAHFVNTTHANMDQAVVQALAEIGSFTGVDRALVFLFSEDFATVSVTHEWCAVGLQSVAAGLQGVRIERMPTLMRHLEERGYSYVPRVEDLPDDEAAYEKRFGRQHNVKTMLAVPMISAGKLLGFLDLESIRQEKVWTEEHIQLLRLVGEVLISAILRSRAEIALKRSEIKNSAILSGVPDVICQVDRRGTILDLKPSREPGPKQLDPILLLGANIRELLPTHLVKPAYDAIAAALDTGMLQVFEYYHTAERRTQYFEARITPAGEDEALLIVRDISERRLSEACDLLLLDIAMKVLEEQPLEDILTFAGQQLLAIFGVRLLWIGRKQPDGAVKILVPSEEAAGFLEGIRVRWDDTAEGRGPTGKAIRTGKFQLVYIDDPDLELWRDKLKAYSIKSGVSFPLKVGRLILGALSVFSTEDNAWNKRTIVHLTNFAEQIALAINATTNRQQLKLLTTGLASAANSVVIADWYGAIQWVNPAFLRLTGYTWNEALTLNVKDFNPIEHSKFFKTLRRQVINGKVWSGETVYQRKDGSSYYAEVTVTPVRDENGGIVNFIAIIQDVTERKQTEQQMLEAREAMARAEHLSSLGIMAAGIAHEINQPLNSLKVIADGMLYWYNQGKTPDINRTMENIQKISKQADRIDSIIKHMRSFVQSGQQVIAAPCEVNHAVSEALSLVGAQLAAHKIDVRTNLEAELPLILGNSTQLEEVIVNLLVNAMQSHDTARKEDKWVAITTLAENGFVAIEISDNGSGINRKIKNKIFEPFFTTKPAGEGMGLGLSIVHSIVTTYGGRISVTSNRFTEGATFLLEFPVYEGNEKGEQHA